MRNGTYHAGKYRAASENMPPPMYEVLVLNDEDTPMDFVILILESFFHITPAKAYNLMMRIHREGQAVCGVFTREVAETKIMQVIDFSRENDYPLKCIMHKSDEYVIKKS